MKKLIIIPVCLQIIISPLANAVQCETAIQCNLMNSSTNTETVQAGTNRAGAVVQAGSVTSSQRGVSSASTAGTTTNTSGATFGAGNSGAYQQAQQAKDESSQKQMMGIAIAAVNMAMCGPHNPMACVMAAAGIALAALAGGKKKQAQQLQNQLGTAGTGTGTSPHGTTTASSTSGSPTELDGRLSELRSKLSEKGFTVDDDGNITNSKGQSANAMNLNTSSLKGLGLNSKDAGNFANEFDKQAKEAGKNLPVKIASTDGGSGGGSGGRGGGSSVGATQEVIANNAKAERISLDRNPAAWAGFYKQMGDSLVGVAQSDIFLMIQNRMEVERKPMGQ